MGKVARTILMVFGGLLLGILAIVAVAWFATSPLTKQAEAFLQTLAEGDTATAYEDMTTEEFRQYTTYEGFEQIVIQLRLNEYESSSWSSRSIENGLGELQGEVTLADGTVYDTEMQFYKEDGWKVQYLYMTPTVTTTQVTQESVIDLAP